MRGGQTATLRACSRLCGRDLVAARRVEAEGDVFAAAGQTATSLASVEIDDEEVAAEP